MKEVQNFVHGDTPLMLDQLVTVAKKDLKKISKKEDKINSQKSQELLVVKEVSSRREYLKSELMRLTTSN